MSSGRNLERTWSTTLTLLVALVSVVGFSLAGVAVNALASPAAAPAPVLGASGGSASAPTAAPSATGPLTAITGTSSGLNATGPTAVGQYSVVPVASVASSVNVTLPSEVTVQISLTPSSSLTGFLSELNNPMSPQYRHFITLNTLGAEFGNSSYAAVAQYFQNYGLGVQTSSGLLTLSVNGTPAQIGAAFHTQMEAFVNEYQSQGLWNPLYGNESAVAGTTEYGAAFYANIGNAELPASISSVISGIAGLSSMIAQPQITAPQNMGPGAAGTAADPTIRQIQALAGANFTWYPSGTKSADCLYYGLCGNVQTLYPSTMHALTGANNLWSGATTVNHQPDLGQGVTIALVEVGCLDPTTVAAFSKQVWPNSAQPGAPLSARLTQIAYNSPNAVLPNSNLFFCEMNGVDAGWTLETALDVEYAATMAPAAHIDIIGIPNPGYFADFDQAYSLIAQDLSLGSTGGTCPSGALMSPTFFHASPGLYLVQGSTVGACSVTITSNSYGSGEVYAAFAGSPMYLTVEDTELEQLNAVGVTNFFASGDHSAAYFGAANQAGMPAVSPGSTSVGGGQTTAESNGQTFPITSTTMCPAGDDYVGTYNGVGYCSQVMNLNVGALPFSAAYDSANGYVYVVNEASNSVSVVSGTSVVSTTNVGNEPYHAAYDSANGYVYVTNFGGDTVSVLSGTSVVGTVPVGSEPYAVAVDSANGYVYVTNLDGSSVSVLSGTSLVATVPVGSGPLAAAADIANGYVYVANMNENSVSVLSGTSVVGTIDVGSTPYFATYDSANGYVYVNNFGSDNVSILSGTSVVSSVKVGVSPYKSVVDSNNGDVYITNMGSDSVSVLSGTSVVGTVAVGSIPEVPLYDSANGYVYVPNVGSGTVSVLSGMTVVATVAAGSAPNSGAYDAANGYVYVTNTGSNTVTIIDGTSVVYITLSAEECATYGIQQGYCSIVTFVAPATGLASFTYWSSGAATGRGGTGGGYGQSISERQPWWQNALDTYSSGAAIDPVVSLEAAFNMTVFDAMEGGWFSNYGGTSFATPTMAGEWALIEEQANVLFGTPAMGDINPVLFGAHNAYQAGVPGTATNPYVTMQLRPAGFDSANWNSDNWYYFNLSIEQPYDAILPGWFNALANPAGSGWSYLQGLGLLKVDVAAQDLFGPAGTTGASLLNPAFTVEQVQPGSGTLAPVGSTLTAGERYELQVVNPSDPGAAYSVIAYSGQSSNGTYGGGSVTSIQTRANGEFGYTPETGTAPGGAGATTYGYFLVTTGTGSSAEWAFDYFAVAQAPLPRTDTLSLCVEDAYGQCQTATAEVTTFATGATNAYNVYPQAFVTLNGVPAGAAVVTEVSVDVGLFATQDPSMPLSSYAPGATLGTFITGTGGDTNFWTDAMTAELAGYLPTQVVTLTATYGGLTSNTVTVYIEPQSGSFDISNLGFNPSGSAVSGVLTFSSMKYVNFVNVSIGGSPGQYLNTTYAPAYYDAGIGANVSGVYSGQIHVDLSTLGMSRPIQLSVVAMGVNDLLATMCFGALFCVSSGGIQDPIVWSDPAIFLPASVSLAAGGTVTGVDTIAWSGTAFAGATGTLSLVSAAGSQLLGTYALSPGDATSGTYALNTGALPGGSYSVTFTESAPGASTTTRTATFVNAPAKSFAFPAWFNGLPGGSLGLSLLGVGLGSVLAGGMYLAGRRSGQRSSARPNPPRSGSARTASAPNGPRGPKLTPAQRQDVILRAWQATAVLERLGEHDLATALAHRTEYVARIAGLPESLQEAASFYR